MTKRPLYVAALVALLATVATGCITVHPDAKPKVSASADNPFTEVTSSPRAPSTTPTTRPAPGGTSATPTLDSDRSTEPSAAVSATPPPAHSPQATMPPPALPPRAANPCDMMAQAATQRLASEAYGKVRTAELAGVVLGQPSRTCRIGDKPSLRVMTVMDSADLKVWRTAVQVAKDAGNFVSIPELGTKAFCGGDFVGAVRVGQLEIFFIDPDRRLGRSDAIKLADSVLAQLS